jgi:precorrin-4 C11-methyltransferase
MSDVIKPGTVVFAGAGPGAVDLVTLRCQQAVSEADVIVYAGSLVNPEVLQWCHPQCSLYDSASLSLPEVINIMLEAARRGRKVLRLHTGDASMYGAITEQMNELDTAGIEYQVVPGVSSVFAAAAALKTELTLPGVSQTVVLGRRAGRTSVPEREEISSLATHQTTMGLFLSVADMDGLVADLIAGGYAPDTAVAVVYRATWPDEKIVRGTLATISRKIKQAGIGRQAMILVGDVLKRQGELSRLYAPEFSHGYRRGQQPDESKEAVFGLTSLPAATEFNGSVAIYALTVPGCQLARRLASFLPGAVFLSRRGTAADAVPGCTVFPPGDFTRMVEENWELYDGHVFIMAAGIVLRRISSLLRDKTIDPAVVVCDERGSFAVSLLSGHIGGANRLAYQVAKCSGGEAVITTATDVQGLAAFDEIAARLDWVIENPKMIKVFNSLLLSRQPIGVCCPPELFQRFFSDNDCLSQLAVAELPADDSPLQGLVVIDGPEDLNTDELPVLRLRRPSLVLGIGCRRGVTEDEIDAAVTDVLAGFGYDLSQVRKLASIDVKSNEDGLLAFARTCDCSLSFYPAAELELVSVPTPSKKVQSVVGSHSVCEAAALLAGGGKLLAPKQVCGRVTVAIAAVRNREIYDG